jgi:hypothetical protein
VLFGSCLGLILLVDISKVFLADSIRRKLTIKRIMLLQKISAICILVIGVALLVSTALNIHFKKPGDESAHQHFQFSSRPFFAKA